ncbi:Succinate dehydrogenase [ubiquinone] flavoprotein subunit, mitochondrial [Frankliniella fusca]|uniref:Succinate dehydrogenase [ubiquinone] flavoprotein subunit, mitochondrial n=1 Tax=Frankliniella fusca TaxID=407009 RepID=A0AAE1LJ87_9NEOP|nr:Succinate dehydrogenase [ubiquinone] flavoprotein subunit, mitochondrial [Frankliniella fusca]
MSKSAVELQQTLEAEEAQARERAENDDDGFWSEFDSSVRARAPYAGQDAAGGLPVEFRQYLNSHSVSRKENPNPLAV